MAAQGSHPIHAGTHAMLPYLTTIGGLMMLGWVAASIVTRYRGSRGQRRAQPADARLDRGRTIYRNTPMADVEYESQGLH